MTNNEGAWKRSARDLRALLDGFAHRTPGSAEAIRQIAFSDIRQALKNRQLAESVCNEAARKLSALQTRRQSAIRIPAAKLLVAGLPASLEAFRRLLKRRNDRWMYEVHHDLLMFMPDLLEERIPPRVVNALADMLAEYLRDTRVRTAGAAFEAGYVFGTHFPVAIAERSVEPSLSPESHPVARAEAVHAFGGLLRRSAASQVRIQRLRDFAARDRSKRVRAAAANELSRLESHTAPRARRSGKRRA